MPCRTAKRIHQVRSSAMQYSLPKSLCQTAKQIRQVRFHAAKIRKPKRRSNTEEANTAEANTALRIRDHAHLREILVLACLAYVHISLDHSICWSCQTAGFVSSTHIPALHRVAFK